MKNILFLCSGNSARSIMAEALMSRLSEGRFKAYSAGMDTRDQPNPWALRLLEREGYDIGMFRCKAWSEFRSKHAPKMDLIVAICDRSVEPLRANWPDETVIEQWSISDPAEDVGDDREMEQAFDGVYREIEQKVRALVAQSVDDTDQSDMDLGQERRLKRAAN
ncbi:arsenate reductase [Cohaesibacter sp. ES.047]|uniref:arsenate reductase ArsC n=1 Tax=Cohaesibacter sp. ES.047 TaxID=1798205 RepID=UPI000BB6B92E|nr:arsenate reductase ArsC [Cohaesibacter sp. ES.047]SNY92446.1 arsenate reductase [Cohaesibacter sp. ES.047]